ncbi:MAG: hypothetical protein ROR55_06370 [Devosia sp.]
MGGIGSGEYKGRPEVGDGLVLDITILLRDSGIGPDEVRGTLSWLGQTPNEKTASALYSGWIDEAQGLGELGLEYHFVDLRDGSSQKIVQWIDLEGLPQPYGGRIWHFRCPESNRRCRKLFKPPGAQRFAARQVHGLLYPSQGRAPRERAILQALKIRTQLGASSRMGTPVKKPVSMHHSTYERHLHRLENYERIGCELVRERLLKMQKRLTERSAGK